MAAPPKHANEEQFRRRVAVQTSRDQEVGQGDAVGGFGPFGWEGGEGGACDSGTEIDVHEDGEEDVIGLIRGLV